MQADAEFVARVIEAALANRSAITANEEDGKRVAAFIEAVSAAAHEAWRKVVGSKKD